MFANQIKLPILLQNHADMPKRYKDLWDSDPQGHHHPLSHQDDPLSVQVLGEPTRVQSRQVSLKSKLDGQVQYIITGFNNCEEKLIPLPPPQTKVAH